MKKGMGIVMVLALVAALSGGCYSLIEKKVTNRMKVSEPVSRPYAIEPKTVEVDGLNISYMEAGQGPDVLMIHGGVVPLNGLKSLFAQPLLDVPSVLVGHVPLIQSTAHIGAISASETWNYNIDALAEDFHVVAMDLPGFGASDKPDIAYKMEDFVTYVDGFIEAMEMKDVKVVGHGIGGQIALNYAIEHPEKVERIVLVESFGGFSSGGTLRGHSILNGPRFLVSRWQKEKAAKTVIWAPTMRRLFAGWSKLPTRAVEVSIAQGAKYPTADYNRDLIVTWSDEAKEFVEQNAQFKVDYMTTEEMRKETHATYMALMNTRKKDLTEKLDQVKVPVLIINGLYDPISTETEGIYIALGLPDAQVAIYQRSSHYPMMEERERFNSDVHFFLSGETKLAKTQETE